MLKITLDLHLCAATMSCMILVLDIASSIEFWRQRYPLNRSPKAQIPHAFSTCAECKRDILPLMPTWIDDEFLAPTDGRLHVLTLDHRFSKKTNSFAVHSWSGALPPGSLLELSPHVYVESPAFMFLHAAQILSPSALIAFGDELCGLYSFDRREERGFRKRTAPLLSKLALERYLLQAKRCRGHEMCKNVLPHIIERSASPMETFDEMTTCLPYRKGGYGILQPAMNVGVPLSSRAARIAKRKTVYLDMGYVTKSLDIEHHGKLDHSSDEDKASDRARVNALAEMGFEVVELTADQVSDLYAYEYIVERIARKLGKRLDKRAMGATPQRVALRQAIFDWNRSSGKIR